MIRVHYLQHVPYEELGSIKDYFNQKKITLTSTKFFNNEKLPTINEFDFLIIMGGPMSIYDEDLYPWLSKEKEFIKKAINAQKKILGICLGAQLIATCLGAKINKNKNKEIGWFPLIPQKTRKESTSNNKLNEITNIFKYNKEVLHWHGETFDLPQNSILLTSTKACKNQAFILKKNIIALQFHLEMTEESTLNIINHSLSELIPGPFIQTKEEILRNKKRFLSINELMAKLLDYLIKQ